ncbi:MAG: peptidoglycan glycosyltransferase, partial [Clostridia bacterium]|nr:peptidoglycan glycosyltransferase [Clostridia bacterium]
MAKVGKSFKKRMLFIAVIFALVLVSAVGKLVWLQLITGGELKAKAIQQQTSDKVVSAKRGTIYDRNLKALAVSASVETVVVNPKVIKQEHMENNVAIHLSRILDMDFEDVHKIVTKNSSYEYVKRKVETEKTQEIKELIADGKIVGISLIEDSKRYYPYNNFASHIIGFTGTDNQGLLG